MENEKETGCKIFLPTLNSSKKKKRSENYLGNSYLGEKKITTDQIKACLH